MTITNLTFTPDEEAIILSAALRTLRDQGIPEHTARRQLRHLTSPNLLRLALGLPLKSRGGRRDRAGRPKTTPSN